MRILLAISLVAFAALLWASISIAQHVRQARRKRRSDLAERVRARAERAVASARQTSPSESAKVAADVEFPLAEIAMSDHRQPAPPPPLPGPAPFAQASRAKLTYFKWDEAETDSEDFYDGREPSAPDTDDEHAGISLHPAHQATDHSGNSSPAHKER